MRPLPRLLTALILLLIRSCSSLESSALFSLHLSPLYDADPTEIQPTRELTGALYVDHNDRVNPPWDDLKANLTIGTNTNGPAYGSTIAVNHVVINSDPTDTSVTARPIPNTMMIHTPTSTYIGRRYFHLQSRWYQEDKNTQIFRMFPGDDNVANARALSPRVEAFNNVGWRRGSGWYEFSARYTFVSLRAACVFQIKHNNDLWSMQLVVNYHQATDTWSLVYKKLNDAAATNVVQTDILNKSFDVRVLDDGTYHKVYINNELRLQGYMARRLDTDVNKARWGFYSPGSAMDREVMLFVTGVYVGPYQTAMPSTVPSLTPTMAPSDIPSSSPTAIISRTPSAEPSFDKKTAIRICAKRIRQSCNLRGYYLGSQCWSRVVNNQCPGLEPFKQRVARYFEKKAFDRCFRVVSRKCQCGPSQSRCAQRLSRSICNFPVTVNEKGAALYTLLWRRLAALCRTTRRAL